MPTKGKEMLLSLNKDRIKHFIALACIGDGVLAMVRPRRDANTWSVGPAPWVDLMRELRRRPTLTRLIGAAEAAGAIYWIVSHDPSEVERAATPKHSAQ